MSSWISKATNVFKREVEEAPQPFDIPCECGKSHVGLRRQRHQHIVCKTCGLSVFVLPRDVYPPPLEPSPTPQKKKKKKKPSDSDADLDDVVVIERRSPTSRKAAEEAVEEPAGPGFLERMGLLLLAAWAGFLGFWTVFRISVLAMTIVVLFTGLWSLGVHARSTARRVLKEKGEQAFAAIKDKEWILARNAFAEAAAAVNTLNRHDAEAERIRSYALETNALIDLSPITLFDLLEMADEEGMKFGDTAWQRRFQGYRSNWLIITGPVRSIEQKVEDETTYHYRLDFPWAPGKGERGVEVHVDFPVLDKIIPAGGSHVVTLAGELDECKLSPEKSHWIVKLNPETGFLWSNLDTYRSVGFEFSAEEPEEELTTRLAEQAQAMGIE